MLMSTACAVVCRAEEMQQISPGICKRGQEQSDAYVGTEDGAAGVAEACQHQRQVLVQPVIDGILHNTLLLRATDRWEAETLCAAARTKE